MAEDGGGGDKGAGCSSKRQGSGGGCLESGRSEDLVSLGVRHLRRKSQELCIITCKGTLGDPAFNKSFRRIISGLNKLLNTGEERVRVRKVEPWNSVRVTFTIPGDAAQRLRALALGGDSALSRLGILSVQLEPDQVIRVGAGGIQVQLPPPPQQVVNPDSLPLPPSSTLPGLGATASAMTCLPSSSLAGLSGMLSSGPLPGASTILASSSLSGASSLPGPSGIVAGPSTGGLSGSLVASPLVTAASTSSGPSVAAGPSGLSAPPPAAAPLAQPRPPPPKVFPFHSMNQAANVMRAAEQAPQPNSRQQVLSGYPPPPYPSKLDGQVVSPLLVNLLQDSASSAGTNLPAQSQPQQVPTTVPLPPPPPPANPVLHQVRVKQEESVGVGLAGVSGGSSSAFRRLPPPYPGRSKEDMMTMSIAPPPSGGSREGVQPQPPLSPLLPVPAEDKKPSESTHQDSSTSGGSKRQYLINPLTGVLEPMSSEDEEEEKMEPILEDDISMDRDSMSDMTNNVVTPAAALSNCRSETTGLIPASTTSTSSSSAIPVTVAVPVPTPPVLSIPEQTLPSSDLLPHHQPKEEKIKLRLKLDKEAVVSVSSDMVSGSPSPSQDTHPSPGYKVEMYVKRSHEGNHVSGGAPLPATPSNQVQPTVPLINSTLSNNGVEVPRVPPLHISLRGRNAAVVKKDKKRDTKKARKVNSELKRTKSSSKPVVSQGMTTMPLTVERSPERTETLPRSPSPVSPRNDSELLSGEIVPVRNYPSEAEVASILRSVVPHTTHKLLDDSRLKRRESKKKMYPRLEYTGSKKGVKKGGGSLLKSVVKTNSKEVRMMSAVNKAIHRRDSADSSLSSSAVFVNSAMKQRSNSVPGSASAPASADEFRPKVNCVFGKASMPPSSPREPNDPSKQVVVNMCVSTGGSPPSSGEALTTTAPSQKNQQTDPAKRNNEGDDSGIESMDALSEKSPNQGESPQRTSGMGGVCKSTGVACGDSPKRDQTQASQLSTKDDQLTPSDMVPGGGGESPVPVRLTPALYTYSNPEKLERRGGGESLSPSSMSGDEEDQLNKPDIGPDVEEEYSGSSVGCSNSNKSLLEQLLIDMPSSEEGNTGSGGVETMNNQVGGDGSTSMPQQPAARRSRPSRHKTWDSQTWQTNHIDSRQPTLRVSKRKCSESASEGKAEEMGSPGSNDKVKPNHTRISSNPGEETVEEEVNAGGDSAGIGSRSTASPSPALHHSPRLRHPKSLEHPESPHIDKPSGGSNGGGGTGVRREVSVVLTKLSRRTSVRQQKTGVQVHKSEPASPPVNISCDSRKDSVQAVSSPASTPHRRKTRSQASDSNPEDGSSGAKRRRMSKDMK